MFKKFIWLIIAVVFLCSPLWAETGKLSSISKEGNNVLQSFPCGTKDFGFQSPEAASPQDFCQFTNACVNLDSLAFCVGQLQPGWVLNAFQDPEKTCPPALDCPTYPFEVKKITILLCNTDPVNSCFAIVQGAILNAAYPVDPGCPVPAELLCQGPIVEVVIPPNTACFQVDLPLPESCCVYEPYFACVTILTPGCNTLWVCTDASCMPCWNYFDFGGGFVDGCLVGSPGDLALWTEGFASCQSVCIPDTLKNHFKTWRVFTPPVDTTVFVRDQFMAQNLKLDTIDFLSNPVRKIVPTPTKDDTFDITRPDDHLTWYRARGNPASFKVTYVNQFESTTVFIDTVKYLLLPTQKDPHLPPDSLLGHYTAYKIRDPFEIFKNFTLTDQFDVVPESITAIIRAYFLAPAIKNGEPSFGSDTHYVAYQIFPAHPLFITRQTRDQFGIHSMGIVRSEMLLVPTKKISFDPCTHKPGDCNGDNTVNLADIICKVNVVFKGFVKPIPDCRCDCNCVGGCTLPDIILLVNYVFKGGPKPQPCRECCKL